MKKLLVVLAACMMVRDSVASFVVNPTVECCAMDYYSIRSKSEACNLFAFKHADVKPIADAARAAARKGVESILQVPKGDRTFENTVRFLDKVYSHFAKDCNRLRILEMVSPDEQTREACRAAILELDAAAIDLFSDNSALYRTLKEYRESQHEGLSSTEKYFCDEILIKDYERNGIGLPERERALSVELKKKIAALEVEFSNNIAADGRSISVSREELSGLDDAFIDALKKTEDGRYALGVDYPTYFEVMQHCSNEKTRKSLYNEFINRAYPANATVLRNLISERQKLAALLGFDNFAALSIDSCMARDVETVKKFLEDLAVSAQKKIAREFHELFSSMPSDVALTAHKTLEPWNFAYVQTHYKKERFKLDARDIACYFPLEKTLAELLAIYEKFFGLRFATSSPQGLWHESVKLIEVFSVASNKLLGYIFLDLHPRPHKYSHACLHPCVKSIEQEDGKVPTVCVVIANFPASTAQAPSLLKHEEDVVTFFHEFGHAVHEVIGQTPFAMLSGTETKIDFVEMPSQMFEEWMWEKSVISQVSSHYKTGHKIPDALIDTMIALKSFDSGYFVVRQCALALLSLAYYSQADASAKIDEIMHDVFTSLVPQVAWHENNHFYASFGHLTSYNARYYSYLWSKVFALDMFQTIKKTGLFDEQTGKRLAATVLGKGGSQNPDELIVDFLGRAYTMDAFIEDMQLV